MVDYYTKAEIGIVLYTNYTSLTFLIDSFYSKTEVDSSLNDYTTSAQLHIGFYSKVRTNPILDTHTTTVQIYDGFYNKTCIDNMLLTLSQTETLYYNKADTGNLLADKIFGVGDIELPGVLDIGTSGYTNSRIRCNAELGGYTGYAELKAATSYDMFLNLSTTRTDGGWMYFKINNDDYTQLSSSDNKVNIYKDTTISGHLESQRLTINRPSSDDDIPLQIINNNRTWEVASFESTIAGDGCLVLWMTPASSTHWWSGVWGTNTNEFNIWFNYEGLSIKPTGDASIGGNLDVLGFRISNTSARAIEINNAMHNGPYLVAISQHYSNHNLLFALRCCPLNQLWCFGVTTSNQYIISHEKSTKFSIQSNGNTTISGNLDAGPSQSVT